ncbi:hypothetical protein, partial [Pseudorhizobium flavum]|uniref:hypothetical protein n=1 Tax=Pseudorhizobium flavum TaxID=1335061 RepID=UPI001AECB185
IIRETWKARAQADDRSQLELHLPGDRRKEFVISIDTAYVRSADQMQREASSSSLPDAAAEDEAIQVAAISSPVAPLSKQFATAPSTRLKESDIAAMAM